MSMVPDVDSSNEDFGVLSDGMIGSIDLEAPLPPCMLHPVWLFSMTLTSVRSRKSLKAMHICLSSRGMPLPLNAPLMEYIRNSLHPMLCA